MYIMVRTIVIGAKQERPVKRHTLGQKLYSRAKWFGKKVYDVASTAAYGAATAAIPVAAGAIYKGVIEPKLLARTRQPDLIPGGVANIGSAPRGSGQQSMLTPPPSAVTTHRNPLFNQ